MFCLFNVVYFPCKYITYLKFNKNLFHNASYHISWSTNFSCQKNLEATRRWPNLRPKHVGASTNIIKSSCKKLVLIFTYFFFFNIYAVQKDTQSVSISEFYSALMLARHVSDLTGPTSGAFCTSSMCRFGMWYYCAYYSTRPAVIS